MVMMAFFVQLENGLATFKMMTLYQTGGFELRQYTIYRGETDLFILPGYEFRSVDAMITNFHLPQSSLLMLVAAFSGTERILGAYRHAVEQRYRFFSYGDSMFLTPAEIS